MHNFENLRILSPTESALLSEELYLIEYGSAEGDLADPSAAFATVRHDILLDRLKSRLGVTDQTLNWLTSYLSDRTQRVAVNRGLSDTFPFAQRAPQGSCLGPLFDIVGRHLPSVHSYADDTQLYLAFSPNVQGDDACV